MTDRVFIGKSICEGVHACLYALVLKHTGNLSIAKLKYIGMIWLIHRVPIISVWPTQRGQNFSFTQRWLNPFTNTQYTQPIYPMNVEYQCYDSGQAAIALIGKCSLSFLIM